MDRVSLDLKYCYGIKALKKDFDYSKTNAYAVYAPNGVMKSSLAQTFKDAATGAKTSDRIFTARKTERIITDESGAAIEGERILVVLPYDKEFGPTEKTSTLLVNATLRKEYEQLHVAVEEAKASLLKAIRQQSNSKADFEAEISSVFTNSDDFYLAVTRIREELQKQREVPFANVAFDVIFNDKVLKAFDAKGLKDAVEDYIKRYNELLAASTYFKKGTFDYFNAGQIAKSLADNGFFDAKHSVSLKAPAGALEITTQEQLEQIVADEKDAIIKDEKLRKTFDSVAKQLDKNAELRAFCRYLQNNEPLLSRMDNLPKLKEDVLKSYLKAHHALYLELMAKLDAASQRREEIEEAARQERTQWEEVIAIFNDRFFVPFTLEARNRVEVMLGDEAIVDLGFKYTDGKEKADIEKPLLLEVLSTGERKALYILNVIFEVQRRRKDGQETLVVVDDIADSFDYRNKYAIIQYLKDISESGPFKLLIMTHNFDFFRTIEGRFVGYPSCLMASKSDAGGISLLQAKGIKNPFVNDWKGAFFTDPKKKVASIPFLRNLVEMQKGDTDPTFRTLTSMLHWKDDSAKLTVGDLDAIFNAMCGTKGNSPDPHKPVWDLIKDAAQSCMGEMAGLNLENKICLAVAIRMTSEQAMISKINDPKFVADIDANQTGVLLSRFKKQFPKELAAIATLDRVALMTPENIHVNAFMYEPLVDMGDEHLKKLFGEVAKLA